MRRGPGRAAAGCGVLLLIAAILCGGCVNVYTRCPGTHARIESTYQSTETAFSAAVVCAFPQAMSDSPGDYRLSPINLLTVPVGCVVMCDAVCEAALDTLLLPFDYYLSSRRGRPEK